MPKGSVKLVDGSAIAVDVAATPNLRERGLSGRKGLETGKGMLFIFPQKDRYGFWMKEMRFPIDILWLEDGRLIDIIENVPVPDSTGQLITYHPLAPINQVLELPAGDVARRGIRLGDKLTISVDNTIQPR